MSWIGTIITALISGAFGYFAQKDRSRQDNEAVYAKYSGDLVERVDTLTNERDDLKEQVLILQSQVKTLTTQIKELRKDLKRDGDLK